MQQLRNKLHQWYHQNKRDLPWRYTQDPYLIWLSEIILQQTQVKQGLPYYLKFSQQYPKVFDLAKAEEEEVLKLWQGLGYYSRARNLHAAAKQVMDVYNGMFPTQYDDVIKLKGVGDYTASAIASFASNEPKACVDGNVIRVISRLFGLELPYDTSAGKKAIQALANDFLDVKQNALHNQAIMEFGALQCTPKAPRCETCPLMYECIAFAQGKVADLPYKSKKTKVQALYLYYFVFKEQGKTLIQQRSGSGIWRNMYEFPLIESATTLSQSHILKHIDEISDQSFDIRFSTPYQHLLSHRKIEAVFVELTCSVALPSLPNTKVIEWQEMDQYPVSRLIARYCDDFQNEF